MFFRVRKPQRITGDLFFFAEMSHGVSVAVIVTFEKLLLHIVVQAEYIITLTIFFTAF